MARSLSIILFWVCYVTLQMKILFVQKYCFILTFLYPAVVGQEELDVRGVNVRNRDDVGTKAKGKMVSLDEVAVKLAALKNSKNLENKLL